MKIKCKFCDNMIDDTQAVCPHCGAPNENVKRTVNGQPKTIEELKKWYADRGLPPYETTRFFIGENHQGPRAFGIYKDDSTGNFIVYKNKDTGQRAVRYEGTDEAYAVNELLMRLKQEIIQQKKANSARRASAGSVLSAPFTGTAAAGLVNAIKQCIIGTLVSIGMIFGLAVVLMVVVCIGVGLFDKSPEGGYYSYGNNDYYYFDSNSTWYEYSGGDWYYMASESVPDDLKNEDTAKDFYYTPTWDPSTQVSDFTDSSAYSSYVESTETQQDTSNDYQDGWDNSNDDSDYDWNSGDSWDSGGDSWDSGGDSWDSGGGDWGSDW